MKTDEDFLICLHSNTDFLECICMIQVYNIISGVLDSYSSLQFNVLNISVTRGDKFKMQLGHIHCKLRKHF